MPSKTKHIKEIGKVEKILVQTIYLQKLETIEKIKIKKINKKNKIKTRTKQCFSRTFSLNPRRSDMTPENKDSTTTLVMLYSKGFMDKPDILNGLSISW